MSAVDLHTALLRPAVLQILKAVGFGAASNAVIDSLTDLAAKYILLLSSYTAEIAMSNHDNHLATVQDVRLAMTKIGALTPQMSVTEEVTRGQERLGDKILPFEDLRGIKAFIDWSHGTLNAEIRRVAGVVKGDSNDVADLAAGLDDSEDYVSAIKKKHSKTAEETRYQGTSLGKEGDMQSISIAGGQHDSISSWASSMTQVNAASLREDTPVSSIISSVLSTPVASGTP